MSDNVLTPRRGCRESRDALLVRLRKQMSELRQQRELLTKRRGIRADGAKYTIEWGSQIEEQGA